MSTTRFLATALSALALAAAGCGGDDKGKIAQSRADRIVERLNAVDQGVQDGDCGAAARAVRALRDEIGSLPRATDRRLRARLEQGVVNLGERFATECAANKPETTTTETETDTTPSVPTTPTETTPTAPTTPTETTATTPTEPTPTTPDPDPGQGDEETDGGGTEAPSGAVPPGQAKKQGGGKRG